MKRRNKDSSNIQHLGSYKVYFVATVWQLILVTAAQKSGILNLHEMQTYSIQSSQTV